MRPSGFKTKPQTYNTHLLRLITSTTTPTRLSRALPCAASSSSHSSKNKNTRNRRGGSHPSQPSVPHQPPPKVTLDNDAFSFGWEACTIRGYPDGDLVYKFGAIDPPNDHDSPPIVQPIQWSNGIRLGIKFPRQIHTSLEKLDKYVKEYKFGKRLHPRQELKHALHKSYNKAVRKGERLRAGDVGGGFPSPDPEDDESEEEEDSSGSSGSEDIDNEEEEEIDGDEVPRLVRPAPPRPEAIKEATVMAAATAAAIKGAAAGKEGIQAGHQPYAAPKQRSSSFYPLKRPGYTLDYIFSWLVTFFIPYWLRSLFQGEWPPKVTGPHASPTLAGLLKHATSMTRESLVNVGFDPQGRSIAPLYDLTALQIEGLIGCRVRNVALFRSALTHPTAMPAELRHLSYQRLEYLGDSVMELCVREMLMERSPEADEGEMTMQTQNLVTSTQLCMYSTWLGLDKWIASNAYSMRDGLMGSPYVLGDAFEALVGAIYLDSGLGAARAFLVRVFKACPAVTFDDLPSVTDHKGELNRVAGRLRQANPTYHVKEALVKVCNDETGAKRKFWTIEVYMDGKMIGTGSSFTKREAEQASARDALVNLGELQKDEELK